MSNCVKSKLFTFQTSHCLLKVALLKLLFFYIYKLLKYTLNSPRINKVSYILKKKQ